MNAGIFYIKRGDRAPSLLYRLRPKVDLTGATGVVFNMRAADGSVIINRALAQIDGDPTQGVLRYDWQAGDTATPGTFESEFEVTLAGGLATTFPTPDYIRVIVVADVA